MTILDRIRATSIGVLLLVAVFASAATLVASSTLRSTQVADATPLVACALTDVGVLYRIDTGTSCRETGHAMFNVVSGVEFVESNDRPLAAGENELNLWCPTNKVAITGGFEVSTNLGTQDIVTVVGSRPDFESGTFGWLFDIFIGAATDSAEVDLAILCAFVGNVDAP